MGCQTSRIVESLIMIDLNSIIDIEEITNIVGNIEVDFDLVIAYGSRVHGGYDEYSDLDLIVTTKRNGTPRKTIGIYKGIVLDINILSEEMIYKQIDLELRLGLDEFAKCIVHGVAIQNLSNDKIVRIMKFSERILDSSPPEFPLKITKHLAASMYFDMIRDLPYSLRVSMGGKLYELLNQSFLWSNGKFHGRGKYLEHRMEIIAKEFLNENRQALASYINESSLIEFKKIFQRVFKTSVENCRNLVEQ